MRATRSYGRPGTRVVPKNWAASHAPPLDDWRLEATIALRKPSPVGTAWNGTRTIATGKSPTFATDVPARILLLSSGTAPSDAAAGDYVPVFSYRITIDRSHAEDDLRADCLVDILTCAGDPTLVGKTLTVTDVSRGTHIVERDLSCTLNEI